MEESLSCTDKIAKQSAEQCVSHFHLTHAHTHTHAGPEAGWLCSFSSRVCAYTSITDPQAATSAQTACPLLVLVLLPSAPHWSSGGQFYFLNEEMQAKKGGGHLSLLPMYCSELHPTGHREGVLCKPCAVGWWEECRTSLGRGPVSGGCWGPQAQGIL